MRFRWVRTIDHMKASRALIKLSDLALQRRRRRLAKMQPPAEETLRGSLIERYLTCRSPSCKCTHGERHGPVWYLTITLEYGPDDQRGGAVGTIPNWSAERRDQVDTVVRLTPNAPATSASPAPSARRTTMRARRPSRSGCRSNCEPRVASEVSLPGSVRARIPDGP